MEGQKKKAAIWQFGTDSVQQTIFRLDGQHEIKVFSDAQAQAQAQAAQPKKLGFFYG